MTTKRLDGVRVLIVDDDQDILVSIDLAMRAEGALTTMVADGSAAVLASQDDPPELVILDMMLPKASGFIALEKIKRLEPPPLVIMITANEGRRHKVFADELGVDDYMQKPVPLHRLVDRAVALLDARTADDDA